LRKRHKYSISNSVHCHYEKYPYPSYPLAASVRRCDTYALSFDALWVRFNHRLPSTAERRILIAGSGSFSPYPFAVANPDIPITALDLSRRNLKRARLHCLFHCCSNVNFIQGDLCDPGVISGSFGLIDAYGVLHHLEDPREGLKALADRLVEDGVIRIMVYNRYARRDEESIRRALRLLKIQDIETVRSMFAQAKPGSRLHRFAENSCEAASLSGLADALLHPCVHTFRIGQLMELVQNSGLQPLLFIHANALEDIEDEVKRIQSLEAENRSPGNFILFLGNNRRSYYPKDEDLMLMLNPCLRSSVSIFNFGTLRIPPRFGHPTPAIGFKERRFLRQFIKPVSWKTLSVEQQATADLYLKSLFLLKFNC
jgi:SAM-dependent methyltransferase